MTTEGPLGEVAQLDAQTAKYALGQRVVCMRGKEGVLDNTFFKFLLTSPTQQAILHSFATGTTVEGISQRSLRAIPLVLPPYGYQVVLGRLLGTLDEKIELNRQMNKTLEAMVRAIFKDWFVDFGPTRAKAAGRAPYLTPDLWALFPDSLDTEGKPEGWLAGTLHEVCELNSESWGEGSKPVQVEYVDLANTKWGTIESTETHLWDAAPSRARRILRSGDTIVGTVRPGNGSYAFVARDGLTGSTGFAVLRPKIPSYRELTYCAATSPENIDRLAHLADGGAYPAVSPDLVANTGLIIGLSSVTETFSAICGPLINLVEANKQESQTLAQTRDFLLPKLMSGEIIVRKAETDLGTVL